jgi:hypothetical protein
MNVIYRKASQDRATIQLLVYSANPIASNGISQPSASISPHSPVRAEISYT